MQRNGNGTGGLSGYKFPEGGWYNDRDLPDGDTRHAESHLLMEFEMLEYIALGLLIVMSTFIIFLIIYVHDIPYEIAKKRDHPHQDAIHIAGWVSLFLLHTIWPLLWIWAYLYKPGEKFLQMEVTGAGSEEQNKRIEQLEEQVLALSTTLEGLMAPVSADMVEEN